jgi:hypothetical protein
LPRLQESCTFISTRKVRSEVATTELRTHLIWLQGSTRTLTHLWRLKSDVPLLFCKRRKDFAYVPRIDYGSAENIVSVIDQKRT